jgi:putative ABC transport system permease protein
MNERWPGGRRRELIRAIFGIREGVRIAVDSIRINPFRSSLTVLGVGIGVCVVVIMAALISGIRGSIQEGIDASGPRNFMVSMFDPDDVQLVNTGAPREWMRRPEITQEEVERMARVDGVAGVLRSVTVTDPSDPEGRTTVRAGEIGVSGVQTTGESEGWATFQGASFTEGRDFISADLAEARLVAVISTRLAAELVGSASATGLRIRLSGAPAGELPLTVVGVFESPPQPFAEAVDHRVVVPHSTAVRRFGGSRTLMQVTIVPDEHREQGEVEDAVISALRTMRGLPPGEPNDFSIIRSTQLLEIFDRFTAVFFIVMLALSSVGLMVGGVGVVGMMLISVTERTREIGIRKALGATRIEILWQFLVEAGVLTVLGGAAGLLMGAGLAWLVATLTPLPASIPLWSVAVSLLAAAVTGMAFGLFPALRASRMHPVEALSHE